MTGEPIPGRHGPPPDNLKRWAYSLGLTDEPTYKIRDERENAFRPSRRKHPFDMTIKTLRNYFYDTYGFDYANWVFPMDMTEFIGKWGGRVAK